MDRRHDQLDMEVMLVGIDKRRMKNREFFFKALHTAQEQADLTPEEAHVVTQEAIQVIRVIKVK